MVTRHPIFSHRGFLRIGWLFSALFMAAFLLWALISMLNRPLKAVTSGRSARQALAKIVYVDVQNGIDGPGCGSGTGTLACKTIQEAVTHRADDGEKLPSGVYFYQLEAGDLVTMQKTVLLR